MQITGIQLGSEDSKKLGEFYTKVFGKPGWHQDDWFGWIVEGGAIMIGPHSEVKGKNDCPARIMVTIVDKDVKKTLQKFKDAGAKVIADPYQPDEKNNPDVWLATAQDPDGNYIQIATPWEE
jgi:predicted enzyme related to lactoylglutathione lyase